jgi:organic radical activating enzyme
MWDVGSFYASGPAGEKRDPADVLQFIRSHKAVVIWGASYLGKSVGEFLIATGITVNQYWDIRAAEIGTCLDIPVGLAFSGGFSGDDTLVIYCISDGHVQGWLLKELEQRGFKSALSGFHLFMGAICPFNTTDRTIDIGYCLHSHGCNHIFCPRLSNVYFTTRGESARRMDEPINLYTATLIVSQLCNLSCKYCSSYMNAYEPGTRINFTAENISRDIHHFADAVDAIGSLTVMGGEPFLHPQFPAIIRDVLRVPNIGAVSIATNGSVPIPERDLEAYVHPRLLVNFSNYTKALSERHGAIFDANQALFDRYGINYRVDSTGKYWVMPSTLYDLQMTDEEKTARKTSCLAPLSCMQIKNGFLHPCDFGNAVTSLGLSTDPSNTVDLTESDIPLLRRKIRDYMDLPFHEVCGRCRADVYSFGQDIDGIAGEQGKLDFKTPPADGRLRSHRPGCEAMPTPSAG